MPRYDAGELASSGGAVATVRWPRFDAAGWATRLGDMPPTVTAYPLGDPARLWRPDPPR